MCESLAKLTLSSIVNEKHCILAIYLHENYLLSRYGGEMKKNFDIKGLNHIHNASTSYVPPIDKVYK